MNKKKLKINLVFDDWRCQNGRPAHGQEDINLTMRSFHSGSTFSGTIELDPDDYEEFIKDLNRGYYPIFWVTKP